MAKTRIEYPCGHEHIVAGRNRRDADSRANWYLHHVECPQCREARMQTERATENAAATASAEAAGLPPIEGKSQKQIDYAEAMRRRQLDDLPRLIANIEDWGRWYGEALRPLLGAADAEARAGALRDAALAALAGHERWAEARAWLDHSLLGRAQAAAKQRLDDDLDVLRETGIDLTATRTEDSEQAEHRLMTALDHHTTFGDPSELDAL